MALVFRSRICLDRSVSDSMSTAVLVILPDSLFFQLVGRFDLFERKMGEKGEGTRSLCVYTVPQTLTLYRVCGGGWWPMGRLGELT